MSLREMLTGALVMAPMTKGSNLPYRRLCTELGARVLVSEMVVARRLKQRRRSEFALIRRAPDTRDERRSRATEFNLHLRRSLAEYYRDEHVAVEVVPDVEVFTLF